MAISAEIEATANEAAQKLEKGVAKMEGED
jgi:hypothetical protein